MERSFFVLGALFALMSVAAGAFGAHVLKGRLSPDMLAVFETGARYQMYHGLALLVVAWAAAHWTSHLIKLAGWLLVAGTVIFSGSLYALALSGLRWLGAVTPVGGLCFLAGWALLAWTGWKG